MVTQGALFHSSAVSGSAHKHSATMRQKALQPFSNSAVLPPTCAVYQTYVRDCFQEIYIHVHCVRNVGMAHHLSLIHI